MITLTVLQDLTAEQQTTINARAGITVVDARTIQCENEQVEEQLDKYLEHLDIITV
jgi:hypothetical protein